MEFIELLRVIRRWLWLIIAIVALTQLALWWGLRSAKPVYAANVSLQISTPQREDVAAYDEYRSISLRDEITVAINNLTELLEGEEIHNRTISQLGLTGNDANYTISAKRASDADFVNVVVEAGTPNLAAEIANKHVSIAIAYYGELRAQSTKGEKALFAEQLSTAETAFRTAEKELVDFRKQNGIYSLQSQLSTQQKLLEQLQLDRDRRVLEQATMIMPTPIVTAGFGVVVPLVDGVAEVDKLIAQRLKELDRFTTLVPQYNVLEQNVDQARAVYQHLLGKYNEAELKVTAVQAANFIQVIKPAYVPTQSESNWTRLALLALAGSLGLGLLLAFMLQYMFGFNPARSGSNQISHASAGRMTDTHNDISEPWKPRKTNSRRQLDRELLKRIGNNFVWNGSSYEREDLGLSSDAAEDQESDSAQGQLGSGKTNPA